VNGVRKIVLTGLALLMLPLWFLRLFEDEILYWDMARNFGGGVFHPRSSLAFLIALPLIKSSQDIYLQIMLPRLLTAAITIACSLLIYRISKEFYGGKAALISTILFLLSFNTLRFGARYNLEPYGLFFILLGLYFFIRNRFALSGVSVALAFAAREMWLIFYPFYLIYVWKNKKEELSKTFLVSIIIIAGNIAWIYLLKTGWRPITESAAEYLINQNLKLITLILRDWAESLIAHFFTILGFIYGIYKDEKHRNILLLTLPPLLTLNLIPGFILNGPFERYFLGPQALLSIVAGFGLIKLAEDVKYHMKFRLDSVKLIIVLLILQTVALSIAVYELSEIGADSTYDFGFWYDSKIIDILNKQAEGELIAGTPHGVFVKNATWVWTERKVEKAIMLDPDWFITYKAWVEIKETKNGNITIYYIGPYVLIHSHPRGYIDEVVTLSDFGFWKLRK
jgi:hypothetical protein